MRWLAGRVPEGTYVFSASCRLSFGGAVSFPLRWGDGEDEDAQLEKLRVSNLDHSVYLEPLVGVVL